MTGLLSAVMVNLSLCINKHQSTTKCGAVEEEQFYASQPRHQMMVSDQISDPTVLSPRRVGGPKIRWRREKVIAPARNRNPFLRLFTRPSHYIHWPVSDLLLILHRTYVFRYVRRVKSECNLFAKGKQILRHKQKRLRSGYAG